MLAGSGAQADRFAPGTWQFAARMEVEGQSQTAPRQTGSVRLPRQWAQRDAIFRRPLGDDLSAKR
jgi:hypothetical protein